MLPQAQPATRRRHQHRRRRRSTDRVRLAAPHPVPRRRRAVGRAAPQRHAACCVHCVQMTDLGLPSTALGSTRYYSGRDRHVYVCRSPKPCFRRRTATMPIHQPTSGWLWAAAPLQCACPPYDVGRSSSFSASCVAPIHRCTICHARPNMAAAGPPPTARR